jgi:hypothetical protein
MDESMAQICLIGGSGRSGTTILKTLFSQHPRVAYAPEWRFMVDPDGILDFYESTRSRWTPYLVDARLRRLRRLLDDVASERPASHFVYRVARKTGIHRLLPFKLTPRYADIAASRYAPNFRKLASTLIDDLTAFSFGGTWTGARLLQPARLHYARIPDRALSDLLGGFFRDVCNDVLEQQAATHFVQDDTWCILWFDRILNLAPEARLVHIYRDPRDVVASYLKQTWAPSDPIQAAHFYKGIMDAWRIVRARLPGHSFREVSLESLVSRPQDVVSELCDFWELPWDEALMQTSLDRSNSGRWKKELDAPIAKEIEILLADELREFGPDDG